VKETLVRALGALILLGTIAATLAALAHLITHNPLT
jgi:hypothetical protein